MIGGKLKVDVLDVAGIESAIFGMRNPMSNHHLSDTSIQEIGEGDMVLAKKLIKAGGEHRKFLRQIQVWLDVTAPRYLWQELDTYKFGTKNSESTMHTLHRREFVLSDFYIGDDPIVGTANYLELYLIPKLNQYREYYFEGDLDYRWIKEMKRILPESFLQRRTWNTNYEELLNIYYQRKNHRLSEEWGIILREIERLPYFQEMILDTIK